MPEKLVKVSIDFSSTDETENYGGIHLSSMITTAQMDKFLELYPTINADVSKKLIDRILDLDIYEDPNIRATRPEFLYGSTTKIKVMSPDSKGELVPVSYYITINTLKDSNGVYRPFEIFINTSDNTATVWMTAFSKFLSAIFRGAYEQKRDISYICEDLKQIVGKSYYSKELRKTVNSIPAHIGEVIENTLKMLNKKSNK